MESRDEGGSCRSAGYAGGCGGLEDDARVEAAATGLHGVGGSSGRGASRRGWKRRPRRSLRGGCRATTLASREEVRRARDGWGRRV